jgi:hypothetical protein
MMSIDVKGDKKNLHEAKYIFEDFTKLKIVSLKN